MLINVGLELSCKSIRGGWFSPRVMISDISLVGSLAKQLFLDTSLHTHKLVCLEDFPRVSSECRINSFLSGADVRRKGSLLALPPPWTPTPLAPGVTPGPLRWCSHCLQSTNCGTWSLSRKLWGSVYRIILQGVVKMYAFTPVDGWS